MPDVKKRQGRRENGILFSILQYGEDYIGKVFFFGYRYRVLGSMKRFELGSKQFNVNNTFLVALEKGAEDENRDGKHFYVNRQLVNCNEVSLSVKTHSLILKEEVFILSDISSCHKESLAVSLIA